MIVLLVVLWISGALLLLNVLKGLLGLLSMDDLAEAAESIGDRPSVTVVIPARDEMDRVEKTVRSYCEQEGVDVQVVAIDDRSSDETGAILDRLTRDYAGERLRVIHVESLPDGWLGKCNALRLGAEAARGQWLLFSDADCWASPTVVARAVGEALRRNVEHVTLVPGLVAHGWVTKSALTMAFLGLLDRAAGVNWDVTKRAHIGIGAFNLIRRDLYESFQGHTPLRMEVIDDLKLGLLVRRHGGRTRLLAAFHDLEVDYGSSIPALLHVVEKNLLAMFFYSFTLAIILCILTAVIWLAGLLGFLTGTAGGWFATISLALHAPAAGALARRIGWRPTVGLASPLLVPIMIAGVVRSAWMTKKRDGVTWRDTHYSLAELREGLVR